jgi:hypothetical protein
MNNGRPALAPNDEGSSTCPQPCKPLLAEWIAGASNSQDGDWDDDDDNGRGMIGNRGSRGPSSTHPNNTAPTSSSASNCLQGGSWVLGADNNRDEDNDADGDKHTETRGPSPPCLHGFFHVYNCIAPSCLVPGRFNKYIFSYLMFV